MAEMSRRTGFSQLTDLELELLDQAVLQPGSRASFRNEVFPGQYNRPSHGLDDAALNRTLDRFEELGWVSGRNYSSPWSDADRSIELTSLGGQLWESERLPDWTRHVMDSGVGWGFDDRKRYRASMYGYSPRIVREFFDAARISGFFRIVGPTRTAAAMRKWVYWRPRQMEHRLSFWIRDTDGDWRRREDIRTWWRFPDEIGKLWGMPRA
jgi:hypothetical protein